LQKTSIYYIIEYIYSVIMLGMIYEEKKSQQETTKTSAFDIDTKSQENISIDIFSIEADATKNNIVPAVLKDVVNNIMQDPQQPPEKPYQDKIGELINQWKVAYALSQTIALVSDIFSSSKNKAGLDNFKKYTVDFSKMSNEELHSHMDWLQSRISQLWLSVNQKLRFSYLYSIAKNEKISRKSPSDNAFEIFAKNVQLWDVLLMNKDSKWWSWFVDWIELKLANEWLQIVSNSIRTHVVLVTNIVATNIEITHASWRAGMVLKEDLESYLKSYEAVDLCTLQQPLDSVQKSIDYAYSLIGKPYDKKAAAKQALTGKNDQNNIYNCGELVADSLVAANPIKFGNLESKTFPSDFLFNNYLQPSYMTTIFS